MNKSLRTGAWVSAALLGLAVTSVQAAPIIFDNFNVDEGHFGYAPSFSGTSVGEDPTSTADRDTTVAFEGAASQKLVLVHDATTTPLRIRHISGGPPYTSANGASPAGNAGFAFTTGAGEDGFIGFWLRTTAQGWQVSLNLDGPGNTAAEMDGSSSVAVNGDGQWHLYEWDLDSATQWGAVPSIGGGHGGSVANGSHTIDSIYFRDLDGTPGPTAEFHLDFVAKSDSGSIAALVPEPGSIAVLGLAGLGVLRRRRR